MRMCSKLLLKLNTSCNRECTILEENDEQCASSVASLRVGLQRSDEYLRKGMSNLDSWRSMANCMFCKCC